jgi:hypothetical protein
MRKRILKLSGSSAAIFAICFSLIAPAQNPCPKEVLDRVAGTQAVASPLSLRTGDRLYVPRSDGSFSLGELIEVKGNEVWFRVPTADGFGRKAVTLEELSQANPFRIGQEVLVPRSGGPDTLGVIVELDPATKMAKVQVAAPHLPEGTGVKGVRFHLVKLPEAFELSSKPLLPEYRAGNGDAIRIDYQSPDLRKQMQKALQRMSAGGAKAHIRADAPTSSEMEAVSKAWLSSVWSIEQTRPGRFPHWRPKYGEKRNENIQAGGGVADLGEIIACKAAVCRELSLFGSIALAELGYTTQVAKGNIRNGGHAWIEFVEPKTKKVIGVLDSNNQEKFFQILRNIIE